jgi:hypothetical protein
MWQVYLAPQIPRWLGIEGAQVMRAAGAIEIALAIGVALRPRRFGYLLSAWLYLVALSLILSWSFLDVALMDLVLALAALVLGRLAGLAGE